MKEKKPFWKSKTLWGIVTTVLGLILRKQGIDIPIEVIYGTTGFTAYGMRDAIGKIST